jgi:type IV pilus assembly protein PilB
MAELAPVGQLLVAAGLIDQAALERCLQEQSQSGRDIGSILIDRGLITQDDLARTLAKHYRVPAVDLDKLTIEEKVLGLVPEDVARKHNVLPLRRMGDTLTVAMANPANMSAIDDLRFITGHKVEPVVVPEIAISAAIEGYYGSGGSESLAVDADLEIVEVEPDQEEEDVDLTAAEVVVDAPVVKLVNGILIDAVQKEATHIHLEPDEEGITRVRYRIDGQLREVASVRRMRAALASRIKIISDLNIAERRLPQEGRFNLRVGENTVGFKTSSLPTSHGERFLLEILDQRGTLGDIDDLGFLPDDAESCRFSRQRTQSSGP